eukprot:545253-Alexandrium_andersonii.AAC.1
MRVLAHVSLQVRGALLAPCARNAPDMLRWRRHPNRKSAVRRSRDPLSGPLAWGFGRGLMAKMGLMRSRDGPRIGRRGDID